jgi:hypothetical protein
MRSFPSTGAAILISYTYYVYVFKIYFKQNNVMFKIWRYNVSEPAARPLITTGLDIYFVQSLF